MTGSQAFAKLKPTGWIRSVRLDDIVLMLLLIAALFNYGSVWMGLSGGTIIALRAACLAPGMVVAAFLVLRGRATPLGVAVLGYSLLRMVQGCFAVNPGNAILQGMLALLVFVVPKRFADRYGADKTVSLVFWAFLFVTVAMDLFVFSTNGDGYLVHESEWSWSSNYIFGSKFMLAYINMLFFGLCLYKLSSRVLAVLLAAFCISACSVAQCSTGVTGILVMAGVYLAYGPLKAILNSKWCVFGIVILMAGISVGAAELFQLPIVQSFIVGVLGESSDLTGRLTIYPHLVRLWFEQPWLGYGSDGAVNLLMMNSISAPNTQEGLFQILFSNGLVGGGLFLAVCVFSLRNVSRLERCGRGVYAFVVAMAFCSLVEINLSALFLLGLSLVNVITSSAFGTEIVSVAEGGYGERVGRRSNGT